MFLAIFVLLRLTNYLVIQLNTLNPKYMKYLFILILFFASHSCNKDHLEETPVNDMNIYKPTKLDFNNDGIDDLILTISNGGTADVPQSSGSNVFLISSADTNLTFLAKTKYRDDYWFLENETIDFNTNFLSYSEFFASLYARLIKNGKYSSNWTIDDDFSTKKYLVFQNKKNSNTKYGWLKIEFNISSKNLEVIDYFETTTRTFTAGKK